MQAIPALPWPQDGGGEIRIRGGLGDIETLSNRYNFVFNERGINRIGVISEFEDLYVINSIDPELLGTISSIHEETVDGEQIGIVEITAGNLENSLLSVTPNTGASPSVALPIELATTGYFEINVLGYDSLEDLYQDQALTFDAEVNNTQVTLRIDVIEGNYKLRDVDLEVTLASLAMSNGIISVDTSDYQTAAHDYGITAVNFQ